MRKDYNTADWQEAGRQSVMLNILTPGGFWEVTGLVPHSRESLDSHVLIG